MLKLAFILNFSLLISNHPMMMIFIIMMLTLFIAITSINIMKTTWLAMFIILMMMGGLMILFIYMASVSENDKLINLKFMPIIPITLLMTQKMTMFKMYTKPTNLTQFYISPSMSLTILMMIILLLNLYLILKFINKINLSLFLT